MTKSEAIRLMRSGVKVTHRYFTDNETVTIVDGYYKTEDGIMQTSTEFWSTRRDPAWDEDWQIVFSEAIPMKAGDPRVLINGEPVKMDFRIISEDNYQLLTSGNLPPVFFTHLKR